MSTFWGGVFHIWITRVGQLGFTENCHEALKVNKINDGLDKSHFVWEIFLFPLQENLLWLFCGVFFSPDVYKKSSGRVAN